MNLGNYKTGNRGLAWSRRNEGTRWHNSRGTPFENEHLGIYGTCHTEVAMSYVPPKCGAKFRYVRYFSACNLPPWTLMSDCNGPFTSEFIISQDIKY